MSDKLTKFKRPARIVICYYPIKNGKPCGCGNKFHTHEYDNLVSFVKKYNDVIDDSIHVSNIIYNNLYKYEFILSVHTHNLMNKVYHEWLIDNKYYVIPNHMYSVNDWIRININDVGFNITIKPKYTCMSTLKKFIDFCDHTQLLSKWYHEWSEYYYTKYSLLSLLAI
jgi:hypothetical protein